ncbi:putative abnormal long morphology protein 1 (Sp8) [Schistosoma mansoni]|uniref:putative abnormal long morphology protein 1 (Sp8) n=1 Tax=Schistosoma mansoni TaxID=6183 RepID=UPI00022DC7A0|nr:putative abnormal long morphology protein 1 (Sp8) [Schistosoma mansoni]|eukprot:XP_018653525.1 putative abnormal long morphology protein 1 (Sp8) [Schistosoma mansoni]
MAEFRKCFDNLDTEKRGVITIEDLKNYMFKMHYKETFLHKWIELFDPEHTGFITYEQYCKTLGLIPRKRTLSKDFTDSTLSSSSSLSVSSKQDNINEVSIGSFDKHVDQTNITTVIQHINLTINDEKLNIRRKRKYIDENQMTIQENIISPVQNDILLETTELIMTDITNSNHNENQFIESLKEINNEINNLSDQLNISSQQPQLTTNQTMPNIPEKKSIKKSKRKQKYLLSLETKTLKQNEEMTIDTKMIPSDNEHNELLSSIIIPMTNNYEIQMTDITYTTTTTITASSNIPNEISSIQFNINNDPIDQSSINHKHKEDPKRLETKQTSHNKEIDLKKQYETTSIQPSNYSLITTESTISISTDSGHSEASDVTLSSVEIPIKKEEEDMLLYDSNSLNILQNDNEMPTSTLLSTESNQFNEYCLSNETNQEKDPDLHHDNQISNQTIKKSNKKSIKKKQKPNTPLEQIIDPINSQSINLINQSINQQSNSTILPKTDINNSNDNLLITDNQSISESLIIPQNIQSISRSPQGMNEEIDADHTVELLSPKKLVTNGKKFKKYSKNSKKKHEKINDTINSNSDYLQVVNTINVEMISEHLHEEDITPSVIENQSDKINISCSDTTFPELNSIDPQSECIIEQVPTKQNIVILEVNNPSEQILNESQIIISNDNIPTTELTYTSSKVPIDDHYITSEYIEEVQFNNINNNNNNGNDTLVDQSSLRKDDVNEVITEMTLCDLELNIELEDTNKNLLKQSKEKRQKTKEPTEKNIKTVESHQNTTNTCESTSFEVSSILQSTITTTDVSRTVESPLSTDLETKEQTLQPTISKKKHKKTKEPTEKNIQVADNHENTTNTSELTSFEVSSIPQSTIKMTDVSRTVDSPLSIDVELREQTLQPTKSMTSSDLVSQPSDGFSKKPSRNRKTKKGKTQSDDNHSSKSTPAISPNSLIPVDEVHSTVYNISSSSNSRNIDNNNNFTSLSIPFCKTICKVSHEELQNSLSHRSTSSLKVKNKKHHLKSNKLKNSETNILNQMDDTLNDEMAIGQSSQTVTEEETQENTRKRRFPKSFLTQVS